MKKLLKELTMSFQQRPWLNADIPLEERVTLLLSEMTVEEKTAQMVQLSYSIISPEEADRWARLGAGSFLHVLGDNARRLQKLATETRLGIPVIFGIDAIHGHGIHNGATVFPTQLALAASWNPELAERMGTVTAKEVAAEGLHWTFSPVFCLGRDPRWGRIDETFGEDPYLAGKMGAAAVRGYQGSDVSDPERIIACAKHYIAYGESTGGRDSYDAPVSMRSVRSTFLPPFAEALKAGALTVMAGYEPIDGLPCSAHTALLRDILKDELGLKGFVVTDWMNLTSLVSRHRLAENAEEASRIAVEAGNDMIMTSPEFFQATLNNLAAGKLDPALIDDSVRRILRVKFQAGLFDVAAKVKTLPIALDPDAGNSETVFGCPAHLEESLASARESMVLLKNNTIKGIESLPVRGPLATGRTGRVVRKIAVVGPNADSVRAQFGDWTFFTHPVPHLDAVPTFRVTTMLDGIRDLAKQEGAEVLFDKGCDIFDPEKNSIKKACAIAKKADIVFLAVGDTLIQTGEAHDRANLALSGAQDALAEALAAVCRKKGIPLVSLWVNGKPLEFARVADSSDAILETFNSGTLGGKAAAEILFGITEPKGRLPISFPRTTGQIPVYYNQLPGWHEGKYFDCDETPLYAFGEGLSYTSFRYDSVSLSSETIREGESITATVRLTNTGSRDGTETVQLYVTDRIASLVRPVRELKGFARAHVRAGESAEVSIQLDWTALTLVDQHGRTILEPGEFDIQAGHDSRAKSLVSAVLKAV
ncbi:glycoside hydrolase family 3 C-terminal domain-containing protein [Treponema zuelzerae]|uniref:beta-glucosidase n=1 Tax=Teretinema zuelzerae TaxID=156 RepID=A0AAE3EHB5_9SPIR|nr:glycoside hydrolase family 3 N-terminal domain-containing protein [Teretinema zuelzerae]MCD1653663.1 glycoside hydrolase family 3 C-terminal domain-containing protein [Teretinema zuelzerae]